MSDSSDNTSVVEQRVLDLFDELYQAYVLKVSTVKSPVYLTLHLVQCASPDLKLLILISDEDYYMY